MALVGESRAEYRELLPAALAAAFDDGDTRRPRRSTRDWIVDTVAFLLALGIAGLATADVLDGKPTAMAGWQGTPHWLVWLDFAGGAALSIALWWRRRWPVHIAVGAALIGLFAVSSAVGGLIILLTVAVHRRFAVAAPIAGASVLLTAAFIGIRPERGTGFWQSMIWSAAVTAIVTLWGMVVRARRQLVVSLRDRAERAESEQQLRVAQARVLERTRIAREMHDVLAHRISLLSLHAGALEFRPDASPAEVAGAARVIRASAHQALQDLREVIGVLRDESGGDPPERPQPTLGALTALADESRAAGAKIRLDVRIEPSDVPDGTGRTAYRIVQEGLTNARKHAPGTAVSVEVGGAAGTGLVIAIRNPWPVAGGVDRASIPDLGVAGPGVAGSGVAGSGVAGPGVAGPGVAGPGVAGLGVPGLGVAGLGVPRSDVAGSGVLGTGIPGAGTGLVGLAERAALAGGRLAHGRTGENEFVLTAWLPWPR